MEIITQNYEKILEKMIISKFSEIINVNNNPNDNKVFNYIKILDTLDERLCDIALTSLKTIIESIDHGYKNSPERMHKYHVKARCSRTIMTIFGELTYNKTVYSNKHTYKTYCYIDDYLGLKKYDYFDPYIKATILDYAADNPSPKVAKIINDMIGKRVKLDKPFQYISRQTIRNIILSSKFSNPELKVLDTPDDLYIMADEKFVATQNNNNQDAMIKEIVVFDGRITRKKRTSLLNKYIFASHKNSDLINSCLDYLYYAYDLDKVKNIFVMGDGAKWIKNLMFDLKPNNNVNISFNLDKFHYKQALHHIAQNENIEDILNIYILSNMKDDFIKCCDSLISSFPYRKDTIEEKKQYILNNWKYINNLYDNELKCPMESQISHNLADLFSSRPKGYSLKTLYKLINIRLLFKNNHNIKLLYLNNFNKKEIINFNQKSLNFNIFHPINNYKFDHSLIPENYHPSHFYDNSFNINMDYKIFNFKY